MVDYRRQLGIFVDWIILGHMSIHQPRVVAIFHQPARQSRLWIVVWITRLHTVDKERGYRCFIV